MTSLLQSLCKLSQSIFGNLKTAPMEPGTEEARSKLLALFSQLTLKDFNLTPNELSIQKSIPAFLQAPISFMNVFENDAFSLTLFGLRRSTSHIPLHDHPGMEAHMRCVHGAVAVKSYSILENADVQIPVEIGDRFRRGFPIHQIVPAICVGEEVLSSDTPRVCSLTPYERNLHEIKPVSSGLAVIADIISPPYTCETKSFFYEVIDTIYDAKLNKSITWLFRTTDGGDYYCDSIRYTGPPLEI